MEDVTPLEVPVHPARMVRQYLLSFAFLMACIGVGLWLRPFLAKSAQQYRHRVNVISNVTIRGPYVASFTSSVMDEHLSISHPQSEIYGDTDWLSTRHSNGDGLATVADDQWASGVAKEYPEAKDLPTLLSMLERAGRHSDGFRLAQLAVSKLKAGELEYSFLRRWVEACCSDPARAHFARREYFLGLDAVRRGLRLIRLAPLENRSGASSLIEVASPLIIAAAFLPDSLDAAVDDVDYSEIAELILKRDFTALGARAPDNRLSGLAAYARGVEHLNSDDWDNADKQFALAASQAVKLETADLARFMGVRTRFWAMHYAIEGLRKSAATEETSDHGLRKAPSADVSQEDSKEVLNEWKVRMFSRILIEELINSGVLHRKRPDLKLTLPPGKGAAHREPNYRFIAAQCKIGRESLRELIRTIKTRYWVRQVAEYREDLEAQCAGV